jgi:demethylmenaquinone methyltransferase/2-methoxy-6-polyprenyl-1,4-benzoquinol methylase
MPNNFLFDLLAPFYDHMISEKEQDTLRQPLNLPADGWLLDAGGGTGRASSPLVPLVDHMVIADLSFTMLQAAKEKGIPNLVQATSTAMPFAPETFNRIMVIDALHHMEDQNGSVTELLRALKPGGRMLIEEPDINIFGVKLIAVMEKLLMMKSHFHSPAEIAEMVFANGVKTEISSDGNASAWVIADK